jgi:hypothetical protein
MLLAYTSARAGGGPENVFLIVNSNSDSSKTIANHYIALRKIPGTNVLNLDWKGNLEIGSAKNFRDRILVPALQEIGNRGLGAQIDYLVYSSDFPWRLDLTTLIPKESFVPPFGPVGSLTGITYLGPMIAGATPDPGIALPHSNWYVPSPNARNLFQCHALGNVPSRGFRFRYFWNQLGLRTNNASEGQRYFLSTMLGVTSGRGNTVAEVISYLKRSAAADGKRPPGTIYFMWNKDVRSTTRHACYETVAAEINKLGVKARVIQGRLPTAALDIMGLMMGTQSFDFLASRSVILPGAICEHLTSSGGVLTTNGAQTPLTDFLKHGAAGASGTVVEPLAIQAKFPLPSLHLHYVRGCSLAESFYQSISSPYQLLIVGDPLCQPWAVFPDVKVGGIEAGKVLSGTVDVAPLATSAAGRRVGKFELFVDGRVVARSDPGKAISLDTTNLSDGYHELRIVGIEEGAIETQGRAVAPIMVDNRGAKLEITVTPRGSVSATAMLRVSVRQPGATAIAIRQNSRQLARVEGEAGDVEIAAADLGRGPTALQAISDGTAPASSAPVSLEIQ